MIYFTCSICGAKTLSNLGLGGLLEVTKEIRDKGWSLFINYDKLEIYCPSCSDRLDTEIQKIDMELLDASND